GLPCRADDGRAPLPGGLHPPLDPPHAADQDAARRACRQLRVDAAGDRLGLHADLLRNDRSAARRDADARPRKRRCRVSTGAAVRLQSCAKTFADGTRALDPVTLEIARGETLVFLGPSGCGKTTTLRIIAGLEAPDPGGCVRFDGEDVTQIPIEDRNVGMVFQSYALFPNMNVAENIGYGLKIRRVGR